MQDDEKGFTKIECLRLPTQGLSWICETPKLAFRSSRSCQSFPLTLCPLSIPQDTVEQRDIDVVHDLAQGVWLAT